MRNIINQKVLKAVLKTHNTPRWAGARVIGDRRSLSGHHYEVAMISELIIQELEKTTSLTSEFKYNVLKYSLLHDLPEVYTSDISYIVKSDYPEIKTLLDKIENEWMSNINQTLDFTSDVKFLVKVADILAVGIEIQEQVMLGNTSDFDIKNVDSIILSILNNNRSSYLFEFLKSFLETKPWVLLK